MLRTILRTMLGGSVLAAGVVLACTPRAFSDTATLPRFFEPDDTLQLLCPPRQQPGTQAWFGAAALGSNNLCPLTELTSDTADVRYFVRREAFAVVERRRWFRMRAGEWLIGAGRGILDTYRGNNDAGQLWLDLHSTAERTRRSYSPEANQQSVDVSWVGIGRRFALRGERVSGSAEIWVRHLTAEHYLSRSIEGMLETVPAESFSGMFRVTDSAGQKHRGYSVDLRAFAHLGNDWMCAFSAEGLLGKVSLDSVYVQDAFFVSARVFEDRDGFLRNYGGITGSAWKESIPARIAPAYRIDVIRRGKPHLLVGFEERKRAGGEFSAGAAFPQKGEWLPYARLTPETRRLEIGTIGTNWSVRLAADGLLSNLQNAEAAFSFAAVGF